jgi:putative transposase
MPKNLKRYTGLGHLHFLTFSCYRRLPLLGTGRARDTFVQVLATIQKRYNFLLVGYVVMPEHVHLLISEAAEHTPSTILKVLKQRVSRDFISARELAGSNRLSPSGAKASVILPRFWQPRFYDFNVYSATKRREKLEYMHANPVKRGLVRNTGDWIWSSCSFYEKGTVGLVRIDPVE